MKFYLYPLQKINVRIKWGYDKFFFDRWFKEAYTALLSNPNRTDNPEEATFYVVSFTLICLSFVGFNKQDLENKLINLPYWNDGKNNVVFDFTDLPNTFYQNKQVSVFKSAFSIKYYNSNKDVSIPQFPRYRFSKEMVKKYKKYKLVTFKGHPRKGCNPIRDKLFEMNDNNEIIIKKFSNNPNEFEFKLGKTMEIIPSYDEFSYLNLLFTSRFSLLPRGNGWALSYRHIEAMNVGSIPVIISDNYALPFSELIDWNTCSIRVRENELDNLLEIVKSNLNREDELRENVKDVYDKYFSSTNKIINTSLEIYINKL
jgi:glucuronyl/N-acetylglucosaminyl transferase EXT1